MEILEFCSQKLERASIEKFELYLEKSSNLSVEVQEGKLEHVSRSSDEGLAIRVLKDKRLGFAYTFDLSRPALETAIKNAIEIAALMPQDPLNDLCGAGFSTVLYPKIESFDEQGLKVPLQQKVEMAKLIESTAKAHDPRIKRVRKAALDESSTVVTMMDWHREKISHEATYFGSALMCVAEEGSDAETGYDSHHCNYLDQLETKEVALRAASEALMGLGATTATTMECPAVFKNSVVAQLIDFLAASFSAENIDKNFSLLVGRQGQKLFSDHITLINDGVLPGGIATFPFDGEGTPSQTTTLIDNGLVEGFLYDRYYAAKMKTKSSGSARRSGLKAPPTIGPSNLYLRKGKTSFEKLLAKANTGILITDVMGLHTANPITGEFSVGASGVLIEGGKLTKPVKGFAIAGNMIDLLKHVIDIGSDLRFFGSIGAPALLVSKLSVGGN